MLPYNQPLSLLVPQDIMLAYAKRVRALRIQFEITQGLCHLNLNSITLSRIIARSSPCAAA